ncbi:MAG: hypothetical protein ACUVRQ_07040 [Thermoanaerobaculaceae bacterium]
MSSRGDELFSPQDLPVSGEDRETLRLLRRFSREDIFSGWQALALAFPHLFQRACQRPTFANSRPFSLYEEEEEGVG